MSHLAPWDAEAASLHQNNLYLQETRSGIIATCPHEGRAVCFQPCSRVPALARRGLWGAHDHRNQNIPRVRCVHSTVKPEFALQRLQLTPNILSSHTIKLLATVVMIMQAGTWDTDKLGNAWVQEPFPGHRRELWVPPRVRRSHEPLSSIPLERDHSWLVSGRGFPGEKKKAWRRSRARCDCLPGLEGTDRIDLCHVHYGAHGLQSSTAALSNLGREKSTEEEWDAESSGGAEHQYGRGKRIGNVQLWVSLLQPQEPFAALLAMLVAYT